MNADDPRRGDVAELAQGYSRPRPNGTSRQAASTPSRST